MFLSYYNILVSIGILILSIFEYWLEDNARLYWIANMAPKYIIYTIYRIVYLLLSVACSNNNPLDLNSSSAFIINIYRIINY